MQPTTPRSDDPVPSRSRIRRRRQHQADALACAIAEFIIGTTAAGEASAPNSDYQDVLRTARVICALQVRHPAIAGHSGLDIVAEWWLQHATALDDAWVLLQTMRDRLDLAIQSLFTDEGGEPDCG